jgi:hypothetical protein
VKQSLFCILLVCAPFFPAPFVQAQPNIFGEVPTDSALLRESVEHHTTRVEAVAGGPEIPSSVAYRLFVQELLASDSEALSAADMRGLQKQLDAAAKAVAKSHRATLEQLCKMTDAAAPSLAEIIDLAERFDESRIQSDREISGLYSQAMRQLTPDAARTVESRWLEFSENRTIVYSVFDMSGFAREMPDAALAILRNGCMRFRNLAAAR